VLAVHLRRFAEALGIAFITSDEGQAAEHQNRESDAENSCVQFHVFLQNKNVFFRSFFGTRLRSRVRMETDAPGKGSCTGSVAGSGVSIFRRSVFQTYRNRRSNIYVYYNKLSDRSQYPF
jgi:hypothetical protein